LVLSIQSNRIKNNLNKQTGGCASVTHNLKQNKMETFKITFFDHDGNEMFHKITEQFDFIEAYKYANEVLATTTWDVATVQVDEL
jgi:hypothetical protein